LGIYGFLLATQGTSHIKPRGSLGSSPLRSDGSRNDQAGEAGPVEQCSAEAKSLKTKGQGTVRLPPQWATTETARRGPEGQNKELISRQFAERNKAMGKKAARQRKHQSLRKKERRLLYAPILNLQ
jgi:hypothetical protein